MSDPAANTRDLYNQYRFGTFSYGNKREAYESLLFDLLAKSGPDSVLYDVGCGSGYWVDVYQRMGIHKDRIRCIDLAPANVTALCESGLHAEVGDVLDLANVPDGVSDLTVSIGVIHHTSDPYRAFCELARITRKGGYIYLNVYYKFQPYYYIVHRAAFPLRWLYWNWNPRVADVAYWFARFLFQPMAYLALGRFLDDETGKTMFMDQVITPNAHLFSKSTVIDYASRRGCTVETIRHNRYRLMLAAAIRVDDDADRP